MSTGQMAAKDKGRSQEIAAAALSAKAIADVQAVYLISSSSPAQSDSAREGSSHVSCKSASSMVMCHSAPLLARDFECGAVAWS